MTTDPKTPAASTGPEDAATADVHSAGTDFAAFDSAESGAERSRGQEPETLTGLIRESELNEVADRTGQGPRGALTSQRRVKRRSFIALFGAGGLAILGGGYFGLKELLPGIGPTATTVRVPALAGMSKETAVQRLADVGLGHRIQDEPNQDTAAGRVIRTEPAASSEIDAHDAVTIVVSSGPGHAAVPQDLIGATEEEARKILQHLGMTLGDVHTEDHPQSEEGRIFQVSPGAGTVVATGTSVNITLASGKVTVPFLVGLTEARARQVLSGADVSLPFSVSREGPGSSGGTVIRQSQQAGTSVDKGTRIDVVISLAPAMTPTPKPSPSSKPSRKPSPKASPKTTSTPARPKAPAPTPAPKSTPKPAKPAVSSPRPLPTQAPAPAPAPRPRSSGASSPPPRAAG